MEGGEVFPAISCSRLWDWLLTAFHFCMLLGLKTALLKKKQVVVWRWVDSVCAALKPGPTISGRKSDLGMGQAAGEGAGKGCAELLGDS